MASWVLATSNAGKLREFTHALAPVLHARQMELVAQSTLGVESAPEPHHTFEENALAKAMHASRSTGLPALADDSGICVDALGGRPGVRSARYWEDDCGHAPRELQAALSNKPIDEANLEWLLHQIAAEKNTLCPNAAPPDSFWAASYVAAIAFVRGPEDPSPIVVTGRWQGRILMERRGDGGFGYDPIFFDPQFGKTAAEMSLSEKQSVSHRGRALQQLLASLLGEL
jgi:XTP/dITP diphosphohydrolase